MIGRIVIRCATGRSGSSRQDPTAGTPILRNKCGPGCTSSVTWTCELARSCGSRFKIELASSRGRSGGKHLRGELAAGMAPAATLYRMPLFKCVVQCSRWHANAYHVDDSIHCDPKANTRPVGRHNLQTRVLYPLGSLCGIPDLRAGNPVLTEGGICNNEFKSAEPYHFTVAEGEGT